VRDLQAARGAALTDAAPPAHRKVRGRRVAVLALVAALVLVADALTKALVVSRLGDHLREVDALGGLVVLHESRNPGAAFGFAGGATVVFSIVALFVVVILVRTARRLGSTRWALSLGLLLGGAMGNLADRLLRAPGPLRGHVVDFIDLQWHGRSVWPSFNLADAAIVVGGLLALLLSVRGVPVEGRAAERSTPPDADVARDTET
jgi:signal peptidase II